jgi:uncharacterized protein (DUF3084 family)
MLSPIAFLIEHRKAIVQQYRQHDSKPKKTWASLQKILPQLSECMRFNTFKQYMSVFAVVTNGLDKVIQERDEVIQSQDSLLNDLKITTQQKTQLEEQVDELKTRLDKVIHTQALDAAVIHGLDKKPKRICGWNVQKSKDGYYRCYRKIAKRVHSVYIGKDLDLKKAQVRITKKEKALGLS